MKIKEEIGSVLLVILAVILVLLFVCSCTSNKEICIHQNQKMDCELASQLQKLEVIYFKKVKNGEKFNREEFETKVDSLFKIYQ